MIRIVLVAVILALGGALLAQWIDWPPKVLDAETIASSAGNSTSGQPVAPNPLERIEPLEPKETYVSIIERPLFRPDRRPEPPDDEEDATDAGADTETALEQFDLTAVLITPSERSAWIKIAGGAATPQHILVGDAFEGWTVHDIQPDRVILERQGEQDALPLRDYSNAPAAQTPAPAPKRPPRIPRPAATPQR